jgi:ABC-2 type transport system ATP-binding protein
MSRRDPRTPPEISPAAAPSRSLAPSRDLRARAEEIGSQTRGTRGEVRFPERAEARVGPEAGNIAGAAPALLCEGLVRRFGATTALAGLSLQIGRGELYGLVGPDGAGKTTAVRAFAGLLDPDGGEVTVFGMDPRSRAARESIGLMPQRYALYGDLTIDENLSFFGDLFAVDPQAFLERRERLLQITRLAPFVDRRADALSGGMYKKLALSCALLHSPPLLLLDEPTNGVDPVSRRELWTLLHELVAQGTTLLVTTP